MLYLQSISLLQFKNYTNRKFSFTKQVIGICGNNGHGKTNLLDAIHYLCFTKSYFTRTDANCVQAGQQGFRLEGEFVVQSQVEKATCLLRETGKKEFAINGQQYDKFSQHIGRYPCVIIAPDDAVLITGGSEERRRFMDSLLSQLDATYLQQLIVYNKVLLQRNALLKSFAETGQKNLSLLDILDEQLIAPGEYVFSVRKEFMVTFLPAVKRTYQNIAQQPEDIRLIYDSQLHTTGFKELLQAQRNKDMYAQRTTGGPHRDDLDIQFSNQSFKSIASQGQRKSLLFALKLTETDVLKEQKKFAPILLLDDIFEKLDESRISNLLQHVCQSDEGQVFITDTNAQRLTQQLENLGIDFDMLEL